MSQPAFHLVPRDPERSDRARPERPEEELVALARSSADAFAELYRLHHPSIARYVRRRVGDEHVAGDLVAETFLVALDALPRYRSRGLPFRSWLYRLASSRIGRWARRAPRRDTIRLGDLEPAAAEERDDGRLTELARRALLSLPARYQDTLALHYLEGLSVEEVAATLGVRPGTVKARLARGRERLRRRLAPHAEEFLR